MFHNDDKQLKCRHCPRKYFQKQAMENHEKHTAPLSNRAAGCVKKCFGHITKWPNIFQLFMESTDLGNTISVGMGLQKITLCLAIKR